MSIVDITQQVTIVIHVLMAIIDLQTDLKIVLVLVFHALALAEVVELPKIVSKMILIF